MLHHKHIITNLKYLYSPIRPSDTFPRWGKASLLSILLLSTLPCHAEQPPSIGNFALPVSQQPGPLIGFGSNIIDQHETQVFFFADDYLGVNKHTMDLAPSILYGIRNDLSLFIEVPYAASFKSNQQTSRGLEDTLAQLEYAWYSPSTSRYIDQATVVINLTAPTGSAQKNPPTGFGSPSFFLGTTFSRTYVDWFFIAAAGAILTTAHNSTKFGNNYLYQFTIGRNIANINGWLLAWMTEIDDSYSQHNRVNGIMDPNSGGNIVYVTPSFWASTQHFLFQFGAGVAAAQQLNGNQTRSTYVLVGNIAWNFF